jgi:hypothetical protein
MASGSRPITPQDKLLLNEALKKGRSLFQEATIPKQRYTVWNEETLKILASIFGDASSLLFLEDIFGFFSTLPVAEERLQKVHSVRLSFYGIKSKKDVSLPTFRCCIQGISRIGITHRKTS